MGRKMIEVLTPAELVKEAGAQLADQLMRRWGGHRLPKQTERRVKRGTRNEELRRYVREHGYQAAAEHFELCERHVRRICHGY